ncbi:MAG: lipopolysaccharide transport periplasmic protein LptA [Aquificae bacterium]|nr:lipopolysaccharide transport periplasmic protein LptA [Aquificota bacterium]
MKSRAFILLLSFALTVFGSSITGEADTLEFTKNKLIYRGNVKLVRDGSVLRAQEVIILLSEDGKPVRIIAKGDVRVHEEGRRSFARYMEYDVERDVIILKGDAKIVEKTRVLEAEEIIIYRKENRLIAKGHKKRVRTVYVEEGT